MDKSSLYPIHGMRYIPFWQTTLFYFILMLLGVIFVLVFVWYLVKRYKLSKINKKPSWNIALQELQQIKDQLSGKGMLGKIFYFRLTWIFKRYLSDRYKLEVYGKTDKELMLYLESSGLTSDLVQDIKIIFEGSSTIKFANQKAVKERINRDILASIEFIKKTIPTSDKNE